MAGRSDSPALKVDVARQHARAIALNQGGIRAIGDALTSVCQDAILAGVFAYIVGAMRGGCAVTGGWLPARPLGDGGA